MNTLAALAKPSTRGTSRSNLRDDFKLDLLLHLTYRFLNPDYRVFACCGMALREANP